MHAGSLGIRRAGPEDALRIIQLYNEIYEGNYPDPLMSDFNVLRTVLSSASHCWVVAQDGDAIVGSVVYRVDPANLLAKVFGAAIASAYRGRNLTERMMERGLELLNKDNPALSSPVEVVYATTRTVLEAPQRLTANLGYRKLGIFPNVHKTEKYETHCLTALFSPRAFKRRVTGFELHPKLAGLYEIVRTECGLAPLPLAAPGDARRAAKPAVALELETIRAPRFVRHRFLDERPLVNECHWFFPFHEPNLLMTTEDQKVEVFVYHSAIDQHCAIIGIRDADGIGYGNIFSAVCRSLRSLGARYVEFIIRADERDKIDTALRSQFLPCAYFPAMQLSAQGYRFDFVVFSRSFEILDFHDLRLEGVNRQYLMAYFNSWKEISLDPVLIRH